MVTVGCIVARLNRRMIIEHNNIVVVIADRSVAVTSRI